MTTPTNPSPSTTPNLPQTQVESAHLSVATDKKVEVTAGTLLAEIPLPKSLLEADFSHNYSLLMTLGSEDIPYLSVTDGRLQLHKSITTPSEQAQAKQLFWQIYRQTAGHIFTARHGIGILEEAMKAFNNLKTHLSKRLNEGFPPTNWHKPLAIFSQTAGSPNIDTLRPEELQLVYRRDCQRIETEKKIDNLRKKHIVENPITGNAEGRNPSYFIQKRTNAEMIGVLKEEGEAVLAAATGRMLDLPEEAISKLDSSGDLLRDARGNRILTSRGKKFAKLGGLNEMLASLVDIAFKGKLGLPLVARVSGKTVQAYAPNIASLSGLMEDKLEKDVYRVMPLLETQFFVLGQLLFRNTDCHLDNILIGLDYAPIGIDMARILGVDPTLDNYLLKAAYLDFPHLDVPIDEAAKKAFLELQIPELLDFLKSTLEANYPELFADKEMKMIIKKNIETLEAHIYLMQEAINSGCTLRQMIALHLPPISEEAFKGLQTELEIEAFANNNGYVRAWQKSHVNGHLDPVKYKAAIHAELQAIQKYPNTLFGPLERQVYGELGLYDH